MLDTGTHYSGETQGGIGPPFSAGQLSGETQHRGARRFDRLLAYAAHWELIQQTRIKIELPMKKLARDGSAVPDWMISIVAQLKAEDKEAKKQLEREWKASHPLYPWQKQYRGLGEHSCAVLVAHLGGDPYIAYPQQWVGGKKGKLVELEPYVRTVGELWAYCGVGAPGRRSAGMSQEEALALGKPLAKSRLRLISESMLKDGNRDVYDEARARYAERVHDRPCAQCKAKKGEPWRDGHKHAAALRLVAKRFLQDLYDEAKRLHMA